MRLKVAGYHLPRVRLPRITYGESEHERHHKRDHEYDSVMAEVHERMVEHPSTWHNYLDKTDGMMSIVEMEYKELMEKKASGSRAGIEKELTDLAAACICALKKIKHM